MVNTVSVGSHDTVYEWLFSVLYLLHHPQHLGKPSYLEHICTASNTHKCL